MTRVGRCCWKGMMPRAKWLALMAWFILASPVWAEDFSFLHLSDVHAPVAGSREVIALAGAQGPLRLAPYNITAPAPSFAIVTGDLTEFGGGAGAWETYLSYFKDFTIPVYHVPGNHDNTWWLLRPTLRALYGGFPYSFDYGGCHFIALDTSGRQDPRPNLCVEELTWLRDDLKRIRRDTPIFLFFHHPLQGTEWASPYDYERLLELLAPYHVALMLVGHGHGARAMKFGDYDAVMGGSTYDAKATPPSTGRAGYAVVSIQGGMLRVAYRRATEQEATLGLLEKPLAPPPPLPRPRFRWPAANARVSDGGVRVGIDFPSGPNTTGEIALDAGEPQPLHFTGRHWEAEVDLSQATQGVHVLRARFQHEGRIRLASREILVERPGGPQVLWRVFPGGSIRAAPAVDGRRVYIASQDARLYALDAGTGQILWRFRAESEILGQPAVSEDAVFVTTADGFLFAVGKNGRLRWRYAAGAPLSAPPVLHANRVYVGAVDGTFHCVDGPTGQPLWQSKVATYTIEAAACPAGDTLFFGAWDTFVYALSADDGTLRWKSPSAGAKGGAAKYFSPADVPPVLANGRLFVADRNYKLTLFDASTGQVVATSEDCAAVGAASDGQTVYLRRYGRSGTNLARVDREGNEWWRCNAGSGSLPSIPREADGMVASASSTGLVSAISASDGRLLWQYQANAGFYLPGGAVPANGVVYVAGLDGGVVAIRPPLQPPR